MYFRKFERLFLIGFLILAFSSLGIAQVQTTGTIEGKITDDEGTFLPGVTVTIDSPVLMRTLSFVTAAKGSFRFPSCPPGKYNIRAELSGFQTVERPDVRIHLGMVVTINLTLKAAALEEHVMVIAPSPAVDVKSSKLTVTVSQEMINILPMKRDVYYLLSTNPTAVPLEGPLNPGEEHKQYSVHGSTGTQEAWALDGVNIMDPHRAWIGTNISYDSIAEIELISGGMGAEIGGAVGSYINVVSKSGGNKFSGGLTAQYTGKALQSTVWPEQQLEALQLGKTTVDDFYYNVSIALGGPVIKEKLWFFINPKLVRNNKPSAFIPFTDRYGYSHETYTYEHHEIGFFGKLSAQLGQKLKIMSMWQIREDVEDPYSYGAYANQWRPYNIWHTRWDSGTVSSNVATLIIDQNTFAEFSFGYVYRKNYRRDNATRNGLIGPEYHNQYDRITRRMWGACRHNELADRWKYDFNLRFTRFQDDFLGASHEINVGIEYGWWKTTYDWFHPTPYRSTFFRDGSPYYYGDYNGRFSIWDLAQEEGVSVHPYKSRRESLYFSDTVSIGERLTVKLGLRYDRQHADRPEQFRKGYYDESFDGVLNMIFPALYRTDDQTAPALKDVWVWSILQPRIGITYDLFGNGKTALKASFSRYTETLYAKMSYGVDPWHPDLTNTGIMWTDVNQDGLYDTGDIFTPRNYPTTFPDITDTEQFTKAIDPDLSAPYVDEFMMGVTTELFKDFSIGINGIFKENKNIMELLDKNKSSDSEWWVPYEFTDPGRDVTFGTDDDQQLTAWGLRDDAPLELTYRTNVDVLNRKYWGLEFIFTKRMSNNWMLNASVAVSAQKGNIGASTKAAEGHSGFAADPNSLFNAYGRLDYDRPLIIKVMGAVILPYRINLSAYYRFFAGSANTRNLTVYFPDTINGYTLRRGDTGLRADPRGTSYRGSDSHVVDLRLEKQFNVAFGTLGLSVDVFNALGGRLISVDDDPGGFIYADGSFARQNGYGEVTGYSGMREVNLTLSFNF